MKQIKAAAGGSLVSGLVFGASVSAALTLLGTALCAAMVSAETIPEQASGYSALAILFLAALGGAATGAGKAKNKRLYVCLAVAGIYMMLLLAMTAVFFEGQYSGVGVTVLVLLSASIVAAMIGQGREKRTNLRRSKIKRR